MRIGFAIVVLLLPLVCDAGKLKLEPAEKYGAMVLSLRVEDNCPGPISSAMVTFEGILPNGKTTNGLLPIASIALPDHFENPPGRFVVQRLPVGNYRLLEIFRTHNNRNDNKIRSVKNLDIYFEIKPGTVSYLGELYFKIIDCKQYELRINDQQQRDAAMFDQEIENLRSTSFVRQLLFIPDELIGPQPSRLE
jgi:hypothetical protein